MRRRPSAALVLSSAALFVALGGPAAAQEAISGFRLAGNSVTGGKIRDGSLAAKDLSSPARRALKTPANRSVSAAKLRANAVRSSAIARGAVRSAELAAGAVRAPAIAPGPSARPSWARGRRLGRRGRRLAARPRPRPPPGSRQLDFGPIGPGACQALGVGLSQAAEDAVALVTPPANWPVPIQVTAVLGPGDRSISVLACNFTGAPTDPAPVSFRYLVIEFS